MKPFRERPSLAVPHIVLLALLTKATTAAPARITASARKRGIPDADVRHALDNYIRFYRDQGEVAMFIGPAHNATVLEVGVVLDVEDLRIIHAMRARAKYWP